ncbi:MAG: argininosuccinate lyase, partial [Burkholderiaceae bacterium]|nr:argininosuccinate lyase [Burkholderiaceae bacterium]
MEQAAQEGFATATDLADYLVKQGLPFRDAHEAVAHAVKYCVDKHCALSDLSLTELIKACGLSPKSKLITQEVFAVLTPKGSVNARNHVGGTAPKQVLAAIKRARTGLRKK